MSFADLMNKFGPNNEELLELPPTKSGGLEAFIQTFGGVTEEFHFYDRTIILRFSVQDHIYYRISELGNLIPINGVTNTVNVIDKSFMLTPWAAKMVIQKLLRLMPTEMVNGIIRIKPLTFEEFTVIALEAKSAHKDKLDEASDIGHMAHKCIEDSINYAMQNDPAKVVRTLINLPADAQAVNAATSAKAWMDAHNVRWQETETKIYSKEWDYAGTMDGLAACDSCDDRACCPEAFKDRLCLIDWKSSNHLHDNYLMQTAAYLQALMEEFGGQQCGGKHMVDSRDKNIRGAIEKYGPITDRFVLRLGKSEEEAGKFESWHAGPEDFKTDLDAFLACLSLTRLVDKVKERMSQQKSGIRAIKKEQKETAKAIAKEQKKLQKAMDKAAAKVAKEAEKVRVKAEAKATRERLKKEKPCTSTSEPATNSTPLDTTNLKVTGTPHQESPTPSTTSSPSPTTQEEKTLPSEFISSTAETKYDEKTEAPCKLPME